MYRSIALDHMTWEVESAPVVTLRLCALGPYQVLLDEKPVIHFESNKVRALLTYLAVEPDRPYSREHLSNLLWPDSTRASALGNLRYTISSLRKNLVDPQYASRTSKPFYFSANREFLQFNKTSPVSMDVWEFSKLTKRNKTTFAYAEYLEQAVNLYRGEFLEGFSLPNCAEFEEWLLLKREQYKRQVLKYLYNLAEYYLRLGDHEIAQKYAWKQVEIEPWLEEGYQQLMRALALGGQRSAALAQFNTCHRLLNDELGIEPSHETVGIYEAIRDDSIADPLESVDQYNVFPSRSENFSSLQLIGVIHSTYCIGDQISLKSARPTTFGQVEIFPEYADGLQDVEGFSHLILTYILQHSPSYSQLVKPSLDDQLHGLFATRFPPARPNPLGISVVRLLRRQENVLEIAGVDVLDGTPLLDIKPFVPDLDYPLEVHSGWHEFHRHN